MSESISSLNNESIQNRMDTTTDYFILKLKLFKCQIRNQLIVYFFHLLIEILNFINMKIPTTK
jgi:hypothetical protein